MITLDENKVETSYLFTEHYRKLVSNLIPQITELTKEMNLLITSIGSDNYNKVKILLDVQTRELVGFIESKFLIEEYEAYKYCLSVTFDCKVKKISTRDNYHLSTISRRGAIIFQGRESHTFSVSLEDIYSYIDNMDKEYFTKLLSDSYSELETFNDKFSYLISTTLYSLSLQGMNTEQLSIYIKELIKASDVKDIPFVNALGIYSRTELRVALETRREVFEYLNSIEKLKLLLMTGFAYPSEILPLVEFKVKYEDLMTIIKNNQITSANSGLIKNLYKEKRIKNIPLKERIALFFTKKNDKHSKRKISS